ncbi:MAG: endonuclease, partial [Bacteroidales bacterium]|nr:endonuclease [Bacteroidales bacterium]
MKRFFLALSFMLYSVVTMLATPPAGYYHHADSLRTAQLKTALHEIISQVQMINYGFGKNSTWWAFYNIDVKPNGEVYDMFSNNTRYYTDTTNYSAVSGMHIGHAVARTWWSGLMDNAGYDLFNLIPADGDTHIAKSYHPLGEVGTATFNNQKSKIGNNTFPGFNGTAFEPDDEFKGDFARIYFYMVTMYEDMAQRWQSDMTQNNTYPTLQPWAIQLLLKWHRQDPVSQKELDRNEAVYNLQGNRNPFVDYPQLVEHIWGNDTANIFAFPTATQAYFITPTRWDRIEFNGNYLGDTLTATIHLEGVNFNTPVQCSLLNQTQGITLSTSLFTAANINAGTDLTLSYIPTSLCNINDTILISGSGIALRIPITGFVTNAFMTMPATDIQSTSATLHWNAYPGATKYLLDIYGEGIINSGDLFFSAYLEGSNYNKAIAIHNFTGDTVNLAEYEIRRQNNGTGDFTTSAQLSGLLPHGATYVIVHGGADASIRAIADTITGNNNNSIVYFTGNDALALYHNNVLVDRIGEPNVTDAWGNNITLIRKRDIAFGNANFNWKEWDILPANTTTNIANYSVLLNGLSPVYQETKLDKGLALSHVANYDLHPGQRIYYHVYAVTANNDTIGTVNETMALTKELDPPLANEATNITSTGFVCSWEEVPGATTYMIDVYTLAVSDTITLTENFDSVAAIGRPLPDGWDGNLVATTNNVTTAPAMLFTRSGQWLQSKNYDGTVLSMSFDYKFTTQGTESYYIVEAGDGVHHWKAIDTVFYTGITQLSKSYTFQKEEDIRAFRWNYIKQTNNSQLAIDSVSATFLVYDTTFIVHSHNTTSTYYPMNNMEEGEEY